MEGLIFVPIELFEERYSKQWYYWFMSSFMKYRINPIVVGDTKERPITTGQFLDIYDTNSYKMKQMAEIVELVKNGFEGTIFFMDMWFPGLEVLGYLRDCAKAKIKIKGILHAGTWDEHDFITKSGLDKWAKELEISWMKLADEVFVATEFHKNMIESYLGEKYAKITVVNFPVYRNDEMANTKKENIVVFPHRMAPEKQPEVFDQVWQIWYDKYINDIGPVGWIKTKDVCRTKTEYYNLLAKSKVAFSSALQETFGIAMLEAVSLGCMPVAPNRLSYRETLKEYNLYNTLEEAADWIHAGLKRYMKPTPRYVDNVDDMVKKLVEG